jgi:hypothetical protein
MNTENMLIAQQILGLAEYYDKTLSSNQIEMFVEDLGSINLEQLKFAIKKYRTDPKSVFFPLPSKLIGLVSESDGRPGDDEAWAMIPKDEDASVIWTTEMAEAFGVCLPLIYEDKIAARMAFKESYEALIKNARQNGKPVKWLPTFGRDKLGREAALRVAIDKNRITLGHAQSIVPEFEIKKTQTLIGEEQRNEIQKLIEGSFK